MSPRLAAVLALCLAGACNQKKKSETGEPAPGERPARIGGAGATTAATPDGVAATGVRPGSGGVPAERVDLEGGTGVPACDDYVSAAEQLATCQRLGPARDSVRESLESMKHWWREWKDLDDASRRAAMEAAAPACTQALDALRETAAAIGCALERRAESDPVDADRAAPDQGTGVPACDQYLQVAQQLATCERMGPNRESMRQAVAMMKDSLRQWQGLDQRSRQAAHQAAAPACTQALAALRKSAAAMGCEVTGRAEADVVEANPAVAEWSSGVPSCDEYVGMVTRLATCDRMGPARDSLLQATKAMRESWGEWADLDEATRKAAAEAAGPACTQALDALRQSARAMGCEP